MIKSFIQVSNC